ncbi:unnamed protein product [Alopecurus aequalis]
MGATASRSSSSRPTLPAAVRTEHSSPTPCPPTSLPMVKTEYSETRLFKITEYSESARLAPGSTLTLDTFEFRGQGWRIDMKPMGSPACLDSVTVSVTIVADHGWNSAENTRTRVSVEILDERGERAVFAHHRTNEGFGFISVSKTELEASSCIRDDSLTVRCTLSVDVLEPEVDLAGSQTGRHEEASPTALWSPGSRRTTVPIVRTGAAAPSNTAQSPVQPSSCFGWFARGRFRRGRLRDAFGMRRYRQIDSSIDDTSTRDGSAAGHRDLAVPRSESARTPILSAV